MSRIAKKPIVVPKNVQAQVQGQNVLLKGPKGQATYTVNDVLDVKLNDDTLNVVIKESAKTALANRSKSKHNIFLNTVSGTICAQLRNIIFGVLEGYERKLELQGVGYRAQVKGKVLDLSLGFSHPVDFAIPEGVTIETPTQTLIVIKGINKQKVGQVAASIRAIRSVEPYKGKGVRYEGEIVILKETKK
ncbi:MAG: 50S ribosomal protein L6 [Gammaproteobacteria bacterium]|nr:50S ribosomal protein L6 [Gammaproteobacteria bacterium]